MDIQLHISCLPGPAHHNAGLLFGRLLAPEQQYELSNPKEAALQMIRKMWLLNDLSVPQLLLPPQERPFLPMLRRLGYGGDEQKILHDVFKEDKRLFVASLSSSYAYLANSFSASASIDSARHKVQITPTNLNDYAHRSIEAGQLQWVLKKIFHSEHFEHRKPLIGGQSFSDQGQANQMQFTLGGTHGNLRVMSYTQRHLRMQGESDLRVFMQQTLEASQSIVRTHQLDPQRVIYVKQNPEMFSQGVFQSNLLSLSAGNLLICHEQAFENQSLFVHELKQAFSKYSGQPLKYLEIAQNRLSVQQALESGLLNAQLLCLKDGTYAMLVAEKCLADQEVQSLIQEILSGDNLISQVHYVNLSSLFNSCGGPASCSASLSLKQEEFESLHKAVLVDDDLLYALESWIEKHYRDRLELADLAQCAVLKEFRVALDELSRILKLGAIYPFQI